MEIWYTEAATDFNTALPIANGLMGGMVYGGVAQDKISLNEGTLWTGSPYENIKKGGHTALKELQKRTLNEERGLDALWEDSLFDKGRYGQIFLPAGSLLLAFQGQEAPAAYRRWLNLETATAGVRYQAGGITYERSYLASYPAGCIAVQLTASALQSISLTLGYEAQLPGTVSVQGDTLLFDGVGRAHRGTPAGIVYQTAVTVVPTGGSLQSDGQTITVTKADAVLLVICIKTNFADYKTLQPGLEKKALATAQAAAQKGWASLLEEHVADYRALYDRVSLDLGPQENDLPTDRRFARFCRTNDPSFVALLYQYDRYLLVASSRPGGQPTTLQALWNESLTPPWDSKYTTNINLEMNYWGAYQTNLPEVFAPVVEKLKELQAPGASAAKELYGIDREGAWVLHHNTDLWNITGPVDGPWGLTPTCGAWLANQAYDNYRFTLDTAYLQEIYPVLKGAAAFFAAFLIPRGEYLVTCPSTSPEHIDAVTGSYISYASAFDNQIVRELFENTIEAAGLLHTDDPLVQELTEKLDKLPPPVQIGAWGQVQEFHFQDHDQKGDAHRHISLLYGLFPGHADLDADALAAARTTLDGRSAPGDWTGWGLAWRINAYARLGDAEKAYDMIQKMLTPENRLRLPNLLGSHPLGEQDQVFQFDCNGGCVSGITEMLVRSTAGEVHLLPALPSGWQTGCIKGVLARGGFVIDSLCWEGGRLTYCKITSTAGGVLQLRSGSATKRILTEPGGVYELYENFCFRN